MIRIISGVNDHDTADPRNNFETVHGMPVYNGGYLNDSDYETPGVMIMTPGRTGVILTFGTGIVGFPRTTRTPSGLSLSVPRCFGRKTWMSCYECDQTIGMHLCR